MDQAKLEKQNGALKIILLLLFIFGVAAVAILSSRYFPALLKDTEPWEKKARSGMGKTEKKQERTEPTRATTVSPTQTGSNSTPQTPPPNENALQTEAGKFAGAWEFTGAKGNTYRRIYSAPRMENAVYVGDVADENNVNFATYTVSAENNLTLEILISNALNTAGEKNTYRYKFSDNRKTFTLSRSGSVLSTWRRR